MLMSVTKKAKAQGSEIMIGFNKKVFLELMSFFKNKVSYTCGMNTSLKNYLNPFIILTKHLTYFCNLCKLLFYFSLH